MYIIRREEHTKELESLFLRIYRPKGNVVKGKLRRAINLIPKLKTQVKEKIRQDYIDLFKGDELFDKKKKNRCRKFLASKVERPLKGLLRNYQRIYCTLSS